MDTHCVTNGRLQLRFRCRQRVASSFFLTYTQTVPGIKRRSKVTAGVKNKTCCESERLFYHCVLFSSGKNRFHSVGRSCCQLMTTHEKPAQVGTKLRLEAIRVSRKSTFVQIDFIWSCIPLLFPKVERLIGL